MPPCDQPEIKINTLAKQKDIQATAKVALRIIDDNPGRKSKKERPEYYISRIIHKND